MVYSNRFVMCVVLNGQPVSEKRNGTVELPFGAEYSLRFHNKNDRRAVVKFFIDGENVSDDGYVINAHDSIEIKRHAAFDSSFKFVSLESGDAIAQGKDGPNPDKVKGTIEARFYLEKERPKYEYVPIQYPPIWTKPWGIHTYDGYTQPLSGQIGSVGPSGSSGGASYSVDNKSRGMLRSQGMASLQGMSFNSTDAEIKCSASVNNVQPDVDYEMEREIAPATTPLQDGCTVEGGTTGQHFGTTYVNLETEYTVLRLFLQGFTPVVQPRKRRNTNKDDRIAQLEEEKRILELELENQRLRNQLGK